MKENAKIMKASLSVALVAVLVATALEFKLDKIVLCLMWGHRSFAINILLGIATGAAVAFGTAMISYVSQKRNCLFEFWSDAEMFSETMMMFASKYFPKNTQMIDALMFVQKSETLQNDVFTCRNCYSSLVKKYREIGFLRKNSKEKDLIKEILQLVGEVNQEVSCIYYIQVQPNISAEKQTQYLTAFEKENSHLDQLIAKCRELQTELNVKFTKPDFLDAGGQL